ncbi:50S ribosomal protein L22 [bacterium]|nr:MAG: 50S ribosomal protein L22 [bacterium]
MAVSTQERSEAHAHLKFARMGPRKLRRVADAVRGKSVKDALSLLKFTPVYAAEVIEKLLRSAVANAENNHEMSTEDLYVKRIMVDGGPGGKATKRLDPRAQGRAAFKRKRMSHVTITVANKSNEEIATRAISSPKGPQAKKGTPRAERSAVSGEKH